MPDSPYDCTYGGAHIKAGEKIPHSPAEYAGKVCNAPAPFQEDCGTSLDISILTKFATCKVVFGTRACSFGRVGIERDRHTTYA